MRGHGLIATVVASVVTLIVAAVLTGAGVIGSAERFGRNLFHQSSASDATPESTLVASEPPVRADVVRVEAVEAIDLLNAYSLAANDRDYATAYSMLSPARQVEFPRDSFDRFWNGIARTGFFPDGQPSLEKVRWRDDGAVIVTVMLFFDQCVKDQTRSVEHITIAVERDGSELRLGTYKSNQDGPLSVDKVPPEVLASNCPT